MNDEEGLNVITAIARKFVCTGKRKGQVDGDKARKMKGEGMGEQESSP